MAEVLEPFKRGGIILLEDLSLLISLCLAKFMVRRVIRARHQERLARLKNLKLISGGGQALGGNQALMPVGMDEKGMLREAMMRNSGFRHRG
jgi:hypothetical protein